MPAISVSALQRPPFREHERLVFPDNYRFVFGTDQDRFIEFDGTDLVLGGGTVSIPTGGLALPAGSISATELASNAVETAKILDANVTSAKLESGLVQFADVQLSAAQVNALLATNIELVATPGVGFALIPLAVYMFLDSGGTDFVQDAGSDHLAIRYTATTEISELGTEAQLTTFIESTGDSAIHADYLGVATAAPFTFVPQTNLAIDLDNNGATEYTTGDGTLSVRTWYMTVPFAAFT